jgi:alkylated DNA repair protein (DNA oxidative demethylase)
MSFGPRDLFSLQEGGILPLAPGAVLLRDFALDKVPQLLADVRHVVAQSALRHLVTPGGFRMSVAMSNCGTLGWVSDSSGYRYEPIDPSTGMPWPVMPSSFLQLAHDAAEAAGYPDFVPDACLINRYEAGSGLSLHQDRDERDYAAPIVSVSLGLPAVFLLGGIERSSKTQRVALLNGDVVVWGGSSRLFHHGVLPLADGDHPATGRCRINLTFRKAA